MTTKNKCLTGKSDELVRRPGKIYEEYKYPMGPKFSNKEKCPGDFSEVSQMVKCF